MSLNLTLMALLEATKADSKSKANPDPAEEEDPAPATEDETPAEDTAEEGAEEPAEESPEEENPDDNKGDEDKKDDEGTEEKPEETEEPTEDDFSLDPEGGEDESGENPDGLPDPDDDGSGDSGMEDENAEVNVHTNILQLSKLDRLMAKRKCFADYQELRTSITSFKNIVDANEATIDPAIRDYVIGKLDLLFSTVTDYLTYKFSYINYEENLQNYLIFMKSLNDLIRYVQAGNDPKTKSGKRTVDSTETKKKAKSRPKKEKEEPEEDETLDESEEKPSDDDEDEEN